MVTVFNVFVWSRPAVSKAGGGYVQALVENLTPPRNEKLGRGVFVGMADQIAYPVQYQ